LADVRRIGDDDIEAALGVALGGEAFGKLNLPIEALHVFQTAVSQ